jgi:enterochelin esterase-like enzyme
VAGDSGVAPKPILSRRSTLAVAFPLLLVLFIGVGSLGTLRYLQNYWLYRGFPPPRDPAFVTSAGSTQHFYVTSPALGGRRQLAVVYLPPGYRDDMTRRYPVLYFLHGFPGRPESLVQALKAGVDEDVLVAKHRMQPLIMVMPFGSTGIFTDKEWANGVRPSEAWETFVARDLVRAVDARYRTIPTGAARAIAGLSEGGYGALNIGLHHPGEFRVLESWSGYELADPISSIFDHDHSLLEYNSPLDQLPHVATALRRRHTYVWFYAGTTDGKHLRRENGDFAADLARDRIAHRFALVEGGHDWGVWRAYTAPALLAAASHLAHA